MTEWIICMHGSAISYASVAKSSSAPPRTRLSNVALPDGRTLFFYGKEEEGMLVARGMELFQLRTGNAGDVAKAHSQITETVTEGKMVRNYHLSGDSSWLAMGENFGSGIYKTGEKGHAHRATSEVQWDLQTVLERITQPGDSVHWLACRFLTS